MKGRTIEQLVEEPCSNVDIEVEREWIIEECERLGSPVLHELARRSAGAREFSYAPYSHYNVGASALGESGQISMGANIEKVSYSETSHAEEGAANALVMMGEVQLSGRRFI